MGLADWVFPGFLFMVGLAIPYAIAARKKKGHDGFKIWVHILTRTLSLLLIGVLMVNISSLNPELTSMPAELWALLVYGCVFLIWNQYPRHSKNTRIFRLLRILGVVALVLLVVLFKAGTTENPEWLHTSWWGILGLIGWGYLSASATFVCTRGKFVGVIIVWLLFLILNILSQLGSLDGLNVLDPYIGVLLDGNIPTIVLSGLVVGMVVKKYKNNLVRLMGILVPIGVFFLILGAILHQYFIVSKILGTPSWAMYCSGISVFVFCMLFLVIDVLKWSAWTKLFLPAGQNSLTTYLAPDIIYYSIWGLGLNVFFYKQSESALLAICGSLAWAILMIGFAALLSKVHIKLKL
jgi:predicted acyltransferase